MKKRPSLAAKLGPSAPASSQDFLPRRLRNKPAIDMTSADLTALVKSPGNMDVDTVKPAAFATSNEISAHDPVAGFAARAINGKIRSTRLRPILTQAELRVLYAALPSAGFYNATAIKLLLMTCARIGELTRAQWSDIDFERAEWTLPNVDSKAGPVYVVPLTPAAVACFQSLRPLVCNSRFVLPARQISRRRAREGADLPCEQRTLNAALRRLCFRLGGKVRQVTPHDLRSTARFHLGALGVNEVVAERCLNRALGRSVAGKNHCASLEEHRAALEIWGAFLASCESDEHRCAHVVLLQ